MLVDEHLVDFKCAVYNLGCFSRSYLEPKALGDAGPADVNGQKASTSRSGGGVLDRRVHAL